MPETEAIDALDPSSTESSRLHALQQLAEEPFFVRRCLSVLGQLLGQAAAVEPQTLKSFVELHLGVATSEVDVVSKPLRGADRDLVRVEVGRRLKAAPDAVLVDETGSGSPSYELVSVDVDEQVSAPAELAAFLPAGQVFVSDVVLVLDDDSEGSVLAVHSRRRDAETTALELGELVATARGAHNFLRGKTVRATSTNWGLTLTPVPAVHADRASVIHPDAIWAEVDANVAGLVRNGPTLVAAGLGLSRGVLVVGPPGVGKTALCRVIVSELPVGTTVITLDTDITAFGVAELYASLSELAPAAIVIDDLDLLAGDRRSGTEGPLLRTLLTQLDGFLPSAAVLTLASTNVTETIDPALLRPGRFDSVIEVGPPTEAGREAILTGLLDTVGPIDVRPVAAATSGASGADLREIVRRAVLEHGADVSVADLLDVVRTGRWQPSVRPGQYL